MHILLSTLVTGFDAIVACNSETKKTVFLSSAPSDIVNNKRDTTCSSPVTDDHDMGQVWWNCAGYKIARQVIAFIVCHRQGVLHSKRGKLYLHSLEKTLQVWDTPMINVFIRPGLLGPALWI